MHDFHAFQTQQKLLLNALLSTSQTFLLSLDRNEPTRLLEFFHYLYPQQLLTSTDSSDLLHFPSLLVAVCAAPCAPRYRSQRPGCVPAGAHGKALRHPRCFRFSRHSLSHMHLNSNEENIEVY